MLIVLLGLALGAASSATPLMTRLDVMVQGQQVRTMVFISALSCLVVLLPATLIVLGLG